LKKEGIAGTVDFIASLKGETSDIPGLDDWVHEEMKKCPPEATLAYVEAAANLDVNVEEFLSGIHVPTLLLTGSEYASLITVAEAEHFRELIPGAKLVVFPGLRAVPVIAVPDKCAGEVLKFIGEQARA
jgi:pimeloyl-ACP methyl ester carboxylesterase